MLGRKGIVAMLDAGSALPFGADADHPYIQVSGLDHQHIGPNSIDLHLGGAVALLDHRGRRMNAHSPPGLIDLLVGQDGGWNLEPGELYLAHTREATACLGFVPRVDGRSSAGRMGISVHQTAGCGDNGFYGQWTLEITVVHPIWIRPGARLLQVYFEPCTDEFGRYDLSNRYDYYSGHHYQGQSGVRGPSGLATAASSWSPW